MCTPSILVTGSAKRIGAEIIKHAHAGGYNVIVHYHHSHEQALTLVKKLNAIRPNSAKAIQADLSLINNPDELAQFVADVIGSFGGLTALVNNASRFYPTDLDKLTTTELNKQWDELFLTNAKAPLLLSQAFFPYLKSANQSKLIAPPDKKTNVNKPSVIEQGSIINILDIHADGKPFKNYSIYNMAKSAGQMMVQSLALEFAPDVRVNGIAPGVNVFPEANSDQAITLKMQNSIMQSVPLARAGLPQDIAQAVMYLLQASYVTGQIIAIDGGRSLTLAGST